MDARDAFGPDRYPSGPQDPGTRSHRHREAIPLNDYQDKSENLKRIHAQSSAETSGLGDSLQRIHTLSSTETSGYGETVPSPTAPPTPSPEGGGGYHHHQQQQHQRAGAPSTAAAAAAAAAAGSGELDAYTQRHYHGQHRRPQYNTNPHTNPNPHPHHNPHPHSDPDPDHQYQQQQPYQPHYSQHRPHREHPSHRDMPEYGSYYNPHHQYHHSRLPQEGYSFADPNAQFDQYFSNPDDARGRRSHRHHRAAKIALSGADDEVARYMDMENRRPSYDPQETPPPSRRGSNFLGTGTESAWLTWSQDRRASFKRKLDTLEQRQKEIEKSRVSTPVRKARKESVMFVSPELEDQHVPDEEVPELHDKLANHFPEIKIRKKQEEKDDGKLTVAQWSALIAFWEHKLFRWSRYFGIMLSLVSAIFAIASISAGEWSVYKDATGASLYSGIWKECNKTSSTSDDEHCSSITDRSWQNAVIGLLIFAVAFGFLATLLSICGVCTSALSRKVYYYHSAGEIYFICALGIIAALIIYPVAVILDDKIKDHSYGYGYGLGWGATFFYLASAMCMCLDDVVRALTRGLCCGKDGADTRV